MIDGLTFDQMRVFVAVADAGSFRAGAGRLLRAQSAVSHAIARMEAELGVALFDRGGHRPVLTDEGRALLADARDILLRVDAMRARAQGMGEGVELELSLVVDTLFPIAAVAEALNAMRAGYPTVGGARRRWLSVGYRARGGLKSRGGRAWGGRARGDRASGGRARGGRARGRRVWQREWGRRVRRGRAQCGRARCR